MADVPGFYGIGFPDSLYDDLPAVNQNLVPYFINDWGIWDDDYWMSSIWFNYGLAEGMFGMNGTFSIQVSSLPATPDGFTITDALVRWGPAYAFTSDEGKTVVYSAMYSSVVEPAGFGETTVYEFLAFNSGMGTTALPDPTRPIWWGDAFVYYEVIPEPSITSLALLLGTAAMAVRRRAAKRASVRNLSPS